MAKCPDCEEEIDYLNYSSQKTACGTYDVDVGFTQDDYNGENKTLYHFNCPECGVEILINQEDEKNAGVFLLTGKLKEE